MYKIGLGLILFLYTMGTASCSKVSSANTDTSIIPEPVPVIANAEQVKEIRYFRGGWYGPAEMPNWSHDMTFSFNDSGAVTIEAKVPGDDLCGRAGSLNEEEKDELLSLINNLRLGPMMFGAIDGGVSQLQIKTKSADETTIYLPGSDFIGEDQLFALSGGEALTSKLVVIHDKLALFCQ